MYIVLSFLRRLACLLPRRLVFTIGACLGRVWYALDAAQRRVAKSNLANAYPEWSHRRVYRTARRVFRHLAQMALEFLRIPRYADAAYRRRWVHVVGEAHVRAAKERGRGVILVTAHIGNWELGGLVCAALGYPAIAIAERIGSRGLMRFINETRMLMGMRVVDKRAVVRPIFAALRAGECATNLVDQNAGKTGLEATFFGRVCSAPKGAATFALKTGAALVPVLSTLRSDGRYELRFHEPVLLQQTAVPERDVAAMTQQLTSFVEARVRELPEQWHWEYKRWKPFNLGRFRRGFRYVETILIHAPARPDEIVHVPPACQYLKAAYPHSRITVLIEATHRALIRDCPHVDEVIEHRRQHGVRGLIEATHMIQRLRRRYFHVAVLLTESFQSVLWAALAGIPLRVGEGGRWGLMTHPVAPAEPGMADADRFLRVASRVARAARETGAA